MSSKSEQDYLESTIDEWNFYDLHDTKEFKNEKQYRRLCQKILRKGELCQNDRTGVGTRFLSGQMMKFNLLSYQVPILTMKKVLWDKVITELLFFISGKTNTKLLEEQNVKFWMPNTSREFLDKRNLHDYPEGCYGPTYGFLWRHCGAELDPETDTIKGDNQGIDQLQNLINGIKNNPHDRRHILTAWIPQYLDEIPLPPCHIMLLCTVSGCGKYIDASLIQRSGDMFLGVPFNMVSYAILLHMIAFLTNKQARYFRHFIQNAHIYLNHIEQTKLMISRTLYPAPTLSFKSTESIKTIDDFKLENIVIENYNHHPFIRADMAV